MATTAATAAFTSDHTFYRRMAIGISLFIIFAFAQFSARGFVDFGAVPWWVHLHAAVFIGWLALFVTQNILAERGALALHRKLGWAGAILAAAMVVLGMAVGIKAIELGRQPPFFSAPYFLALTQYGLLVFGATIAAALALRRNTAWHRRLMLGATVLLLEPAFGRTLPMPLIGAQVGETVAMALQVAVLAFAMLHDRKLHGRVHPALLWSAGAVIATHVGVTVLAAAPPVIALAQSLAPA